MTKNLHTNQDSPIHQWLQGLVERSLRVLQTDGVLALPVEDFYFTLADVDHSVLDFAVRHMLKTIRTHANGIVGGPGSGKTPLDRIGALCASRYWKRELNLDTPASFRASEFDFFRSQPGRKDHPDIHDDGCLAAEPIRKMKGFADAGCTMLTKERWGAAKFVQGQMRIFVCNAFAFTKELEKAQALPAGFLFHMKHQDFLDVIAPMFPLGTEPPHIMAVLKRANIVLNAGKRSATQDEVSVSSMVMGGPADFLKPEPAKRHMAYRDNNVVKPPTFQEDLKWEAKYLEAVLAGRTVPFTRATINHSATHRLFHEEAPVPPSSPRNSSAAAPSSPPTVSSPIPKAVAIKTAPKSFRRALSGLSGQVIDLCSPPKKMTKIKIEIPQPPAPKNVAAASSAPHLSIPKSHQAALWMWSLQSLHMIPWATASLKNWRTSWITRRTWSLMPEQVRGLIRLCYLTCPDISQVSQSKAQ